MYQRGSKEPEVSKIQARLRELGDYRGSIDGDFGGGREAAVMALQRAERLVVHGPKSWADPGWVEDVRARKLTIANGEGTVHGNAFNLEEQYGIRLKAARTD